MSSIAETLLDLLSNGRLQRLSQEVGIDEGEAQKAVRTAVPLLLGALGKNASRPDQAEALANTLQREHDGSVLDNLPELLAQGKLDKEGEKILEHVLGTKRRAVEQGVAQVAGLDTYKTGKLLAMLAPIVLGALGKTQREQEMNSIELASMLIREKRKASLHLGSLAGLLEVDHGGGYADDMVTLGGKLLGRLFN